MQTPVPRLQPAEVIDLVWPTVGNPIDTVTPGAFSAQGFNRYGGSAVNVWGQTAGAAGTMQFYRETIGASLPAGMRGLDGLRGYLQLDNALSTSARFRPTEQCRVYRWQQLVAFISANPTTATGLAIMMGPANGSGPSYPSVAGVGAGWGVQGNGAGGLQTFIKPTIAGGFTNQVAINMGGVPITDVLCFDFEVQGAMLAGSQPGRARIWMNGALILDQAWGVGTVLPTYALSSAMNHIRPGINSGAGETIFMGPTHVMCGRFTAENVENLNQVSGSL